MNILFQYYAMTSDVSVWTSAWTWPVFKHENKVLDLELGPDDQVLMLYVFH